eukprot:CAMPEP_0183343368 /NCGR_PEP_ID=MMETSP0164_2-20130417/9299_1 /TAXON_ID=221442 /ORGANISM="Coccolithus pelagicus ssp braarudi, Strain PLY182g" /LENGTH=217 /DNA_ID=CAMNT_0025514171 /DNA_START=197 /DNA_END=855 /DNA_ORIENTATION=-
MSAVLVWQDLAADRPHLPLPLAHSEGKAPRHCMDRPAPQPDTIQIAIKTQNIKVLKIDAIAARLGVLRCQFQPDANTVQLGCSLFIVPCMRHTAVSILVRLMRDGSSQLIAFELPHKIRATPAVWPWRIVDLAADDDPFVLIRPHLARQYEGPIQLVEQCHLQTPLTWHTTGFLKQPTPHLILLRRHRRCVPTFPAANLRAAGNLALFQLHPRVLAA